MHNTFNRLSGFNCIYSKNSVHFILGLGLTCTIKSKKILEKHIEIILKGFVLNGCGKLLKV